MSTMSRLRAPRRVLTILSVLLLAVAGGLWWTLTRDGGTRVTAYFGESVGIYPGSDVRLLGMPVGSISAVTPQGEQVRVDMVLDPGVAVPADARAVAVAPSLVSDRYVQFTPVYERGPRLADGAVVPRDRAVTPLELDDINRNLDRMMTALGPNGANKQGALSDALNVEAQNLRGNGAALNQMITQLSQAQGTLSGGREDLFGTVDHLQKFNRVLADSDGQVRRFNSQLADTAHFLAGERGELGKALHELGPALKDVAGFVRDNRGGIRSNVDHLRGITQALVDQKASLAEVLDVAPLGLSNLANTYDAASGTLHTRGNVNELTNPPIVIVCKLLRQSRSEPVPPVLADACRKVQPLVSGAAPLPAPSDVINSLQRGDPPPLPLPLVDTMRTGGSPGGGGGR